MTISRSKRLTISVVLLLLGLAPLFINSERQFINALPTEGQQNSVLLESDHSYDQQFTATRRSITKFGLYLRPVVINIPDDNININFYIDDQKVSQKTISAAFVDSGGASQLKFDEPLRTPIGSIITTQIIVPTSLSGKLRAQNADPNNIPPANNLSFTIDNKVQPSLLAFQTYFGYRPPLALQAGGLLIIISIFLLLNISFGSRASIFLYSIGLAFLYILPAIMLGDFPYLLWLTAFTALLGMYTLLKKMQFPIPASLFGAHIFAFTTWFVLHANAERSKLLIIALLPLLFLLLMHWRSIKPVHRKLIIIYILVFSSLVFLYGSWVNPDPFPSTAASLHDVFLDSNQVPSINKFQAGFVALAIPDDNPAVIAANGGWHHFGSYLGLINISIALLGLIIKAKRYWLFLAIGLVGAALALFTPITAALSSFLLLPPQYFIILATFSMAIFAAAGLRALTTFLKSSLLTKFIIYTLIVFALFDVLNVVGRVLQFDLL